MRKVKGRQFFLGRSGQMMAVSELLYRGHNVAIPEVDDGVDVVTTGSAAGRETRVQVKARHGTGRVYKAVRVASFFVKREQLLTPTDVPLIYVLALRAEGRWDTVVISREELAARWEAKRHKKSKTKHVTMQLIFSPEEVRMLGRSVQEYRGGWERYWPVETGDFKLKNAN